MTPQAVPGPGLRSRRSAGKHVRTANRACLRARLDDHAAAQQDSASDSGLRPRRFAVCQPGSGYARLCATLGPCRRRRSRRIVRGGRRGALADTGEGGQRLAIARGSWSLFCSFTATETSFFFSLTGRGQAVRPPLNREPAFAIMLEKADSRELRAEEAALRQPDAGARMRTMLEGRERRDPGGMR